ncbi:MAG: hypothetical protein LBG96_16250 [Tannerella sp.]|jgi:hypothetical protein|nr:hypothetical protein [Tannerella sp.]
MENHALDTYLLDVRRGIVKTRTVVIALLVTLAIIIVTCVLMLGMISKSAIRDIRIIDRQGYVYTSDIIDARMATHFQAQAFVLNFIKLCYSFDQNNIENNLNRALQLGDETVQGYVDLHSKPNNIYQAVKSLGQTAYISEEHVVNAISFSENTFHVAFEQVLKGSGVTTRYIVNVSGIIDFVTPTGVDNPNGFYIRNFIETYQKTTGYE